MITPKQRSSLKAIAHPMKPIMQIGKGGISETVLNQAAEHLYNLELIKIKVLQNAEFKSRDVVSELAEALEADVVSCIGGIITLYKRSTKKDIKHIVF